MKKSRIRSSSQQSHRLWIDFWKTYNDQFVTHLTTRSHLNSILGKEKIKAVYANSYYKHKLPKGSKREKMLRVISFTNMPLYELDKFELERFKYGIIFKKDKVPDLFEAEYLQYDPWKMYRMQRRYSFLSDQKLFDRKLQRHKPNELKFLQDIAAKELVSGKRDFMWEQEYKKLGDFSFNFNDIFGLIVPDRDRFIQKLDEKIMNLSITVRRKPSDKKRDHLKKYQILSSKPILTKKMYKWEIYHLIKDFVS